MDLFNSICDFKVVKNFAEGKPESFYFETYKEARENVERDKYATRQFILERNKKGKYLVIRIKEHGKSLESCEDDYSELPPFHVLLERSINARQAKALRLQRLGIKHLPESAIVPNLAWYYAKAGKR